MIRPVIFCCKGNNCIETVQEKMTGGNMYVIKARYKNLDYNKSNSWTKNCNLSYIPQKFILNSFQLIKFQVEKDAFSKIFAELPYKVTWNQNVPQYPV